MSSERNLEIIIYADVIWAEAAELVLGWSFTAGEQIQYRGQMIANAAALGHMRVVDLRTRVSQVNKLDREVVEKGVDIFDTGDLLEATSRRICHGAGRFALNKVGSRSRLQRTAAEYRQRQRMRANQRVNGLFQLGQGDIGLETLVLGSYTSKLKERK